MDHLVEIYHRLIAETEPSYRRQFYEKFTLDSRFVGILGARGVGKTTFLLNYLRDHHANSEAALYVSADNLYFAEHTLVDLVDQFVKEFAGQILCIDEIHRYPNWDLELKNIYDSYPKIEIMFSGSSSIDLVKSNADLSRRAVLKYMHGFSFREYLEITTEQKYPSMSLEQIFTDHSSYSRQLMKVDKLLGHLKTYLREGYYPTRLELGSYSAYHESLLNIVDKTVFEDISSIYSLKTQNLETLKKILYFFATSQPGTININRISNSLGKDHSTIADYIQVLRDTGLLRFLLKNKSGHSLVKNAEKIYLDNSNLLTAINNGIGKEPLVGALRETFVVSNLQNAGHHVFFSDIGDIETSGTILEIGGKNKTGTQIKNEDNSFLVKDDVLTGTRKTIPMYLFGFMN